MKILVLCDLHNEFGTCKLKQVECDLVVLAGDTDIGDRGAKWALKIFKDVPIIYICGNHEYYGKKMYKVQRDLKELSRDSNLYFLENDEHIMGNVRILGCTLWMDYQLYGADKIQTAIYAAEAQLTDFRRIRLGPHERYRKLRAIDTIRFHNQSVKFLQEKLRKPFDGITIVVTHHSPTPESIAQSFQGDIINASFCSDLNWMIEKYKPKYWIHGHTHHRFDYSIEDTRIICNPRGYAPNVTEGFESDLIVEL